MLTLQATTSTARAADATIEITSPNPDGTQSFNSGDPIVFSGTCDPESYRAIATLPWRNPSGIPLFIGDGSGHNWSSVESGSNHTTITAPNVTSKTVYTLTAEFFDFHNNSIGSKTVKITVNPKP